MDRNDRAMSSRRLASIVLIAMLLAAAASSMYWGLFQTVDVPVPVAVAAEGVIAARVIGPGTVQARIPVTLGARVSATVKHVYVDVGDEVRKGQLLVTLDDRDLSARRGVVAGKQEALLRNAEGGRATLVKAQVTSNSPAANSAATGSCWLRASFHSPLSMFPTRLWKGRRQPLMRPRPPWRPARQRLAPCRRKPATRTPSFPMRASSRRWMVWSCSA